MISQYDSSFWHSPSTQIRSDILVKPALRDMLATVSGKRLLDLGCGAGDMMNELAEKGAYVTGVDLCSRRFPEHSGERTMYVQADIKNLPFNDTSFDIVYSSMSFLHLDETDLESALKEAWRVLKPGGELVVADVHPTALIQSAKPRLVEHHSRDIDYFKQQQVFAWIYDTDGNRTYIEYYHRSLEDYLNAFVSQKFVLSEVCEPKAGHDVRSRYPGLFKTEACQPSYILFRLRKGD